MLMGYGGLFYRTNLRLYVREDEAKAGIAWEIPPYFIILIFSGIFWGVF